MRLFAWFQALRIMFASHEIATCDPVWLAYDPSNPMAWKSYVAPVYKLATGGIHSPYDAPALHCKDSLTMYFCTDAECL